MLSTFWEGWIKKTGTVNRRWKKRYFKLHGSPNGARGLFYYGKVE
jgi:hypothetical protein